MCNELCQYTILISDWMLSEDKPSNVWMDVHTMMTKSGTTLEEIKTIKNNPPEPIEFDWDPKPSRSNAWKKSTLDYVTTCNFIYNPPPCMIYTIPEEKEPIGSCASESESIFNPDLNSNNDDNNGSSSAQNGNKNISDSDFNLNPKIYIALPDLSKKQELK
ncbi:hypothetical protein G9A89_017751 [Geosiphon pyriformis]|nr:hypothetical protein G9A89_017751 [Geosiphon pyriformis]